MKYWIAILAIVGACHQKQEPAMPSNQTIFSTDLSLKNDNGTWLWKGTKYTGYIVEKFESQITAKLPVINGKVNGVALGWYKSGKKRYERDLINGNREGTDKGWHENGRLAFENFFKNDKYESEQRSYHENGQLWQSLHYKEGQEEGKQKTWDKNGRVINNFTVKNGKLYGVIGRYDCMSVVKK